MLFRATSVRRSIPQGSKVSVVARHKPNVFIKIDGLRHPDLRLFHAPGDARVAGEVESGGGILWMQRPRFEKDGLRLLDILDAWK
jgi:hypothetical protein